MRILVAYPNRSSFVARDIRILSERYKVDELSFYSNSPAYIFNGMGKIAQADLLFMWFISPRAVPLVITAKALNKPIIGIVGGYEAANCPEIDYGSARSGSLRAVTRWLLNRIDTIVAVSKASRQSIVNNLGIPEDRISLVYHGFEDIAPNTPTPKQPVVLTVGDISTDNWRRKGQLDFMLAAAKMPDIPFVHIGATLSDPVELLGSPLPANVTLAGRKRFEDLASDYSKAKVYLQLSPHESFGCSVAEAMLFRCIPVVRDAYALPEVVGGTGVIVRDASPDASEAAIRKALSMADTEGERARQQVLTAFSYEHRARALWSLVECLIGH